MPTISGDGGGGSSPPLFLTIAPLSHGANLRSEEAPFLALFPPHSTGSSAVECGVPLFSWSSSLFLRPCPQATPLPPPPAACNGHFSAPDFFSRNAPPRACECVVAGYGGGGGGPRPGLPFPRLGFCPGQKGKRRRRRRRGCPTFTSRSNAAPPPSLRRPGRRPHSCPPPSPPFSPPMDWNGCLFGHRRRRPLFLVFQAVHVRERLSSLFLRQSTKSRSPQQRLPECRGRLLLVPLKSPLQHSWVCSC